MKFLTPAGRKILGSHFCKHGRRTRIKLARFDPQLLVMWIDCRNLLLISASLIKKSSAIYLIFHCFSYVWSWVNSGLWKLPVEMLFIGSFHFSAPHLRNTAPQFFYRLPLKNEIRRVDCLTRIVATLFETLLNACEVWPAGVYQNFKQRGGGLIKLCYYVPCLPKEFHPKWSWLFKPNKRINFVNTCIKVYFTL